MDPLVPCPSCRRHVRSCEAACPFCSSALPTNFGASAIPSTRKRLDRLAAFTFAATLAATGCALVGDEDTEQQEGELGSIHPMYGMPAPVDAGKHKDAGKKDAGHVKPDAGDDDHGGFHAMYGMPAPEPDAGDDHGGVMPMYGMPAPEADAGDDNGGGFHALYGMPPGAD